MIAQGGDPEALTVSQFLDLGYAALVEEHIRMGSSLLEALEKTKEYASGPKGVVTAGGSHTVSPREAEVAPPPTEETFLLLEGAMKGLGGFSR